MPADADAADGTAAGWPARAVSMGRAVFRLVEDAQISFLAAALAYYAFVSMIPLVVLGVLVATTIGGEALADQVVTFAETLLAPAGQELIRSAVTARTGLGGVTVFSVAVLLWGALKAFRAMDRAFSLVYGTPSSESMLASFADAIVALSAVGVGVAAMVVIGAAVALLPGRLPGELGAVALLLALAVVFFPLYFLLPGVELEVRDVVPGTILAAIGWTLLGSLFELYATYATGVSVYGLLGAFLLVLTWLYLGALVLLLGAAVNAVRSGHARPLDR